MPPAKPAKARVDQLLVERGLAESRARAQALVLAGLVFAGEVKLAKPGQTVPADAALEVRGRDHPWVSRGGLKLAHALDQFAIDPTGWTAVDVGASTGGFTDVLLQRSATRVVGALVVGSAMYLAPAPVASAAPCAQSPRPTPRAPRQWGSHRR